MEIYKQSQREIRFITLFRRFQVETLWVEVRKDPDRIVAFIHIPSGKDANFIFHTKLTQIAPVYSILPVDEGNIFFFGAETKKNGKSYRLRTLITREDLFDFINSDWDRNVIRNVIRERLSIVYSSGTEILPTYYNQTKAKRLYSCLHQDRRVKKDAYMFDVDVALLQVGGRDFVSLIEYKHGNEILYRKDIVSYNERVGYSFLSQYYRTLLIVGTNSFSVYDFTGFHEELIDKVKRENLEDFLSEILEKRARA